jgi:hypothetical protein
MTGLRPGTLTPEWNDTNRSLTPAEIALVRAMNASLRSVALDEMVHNKLMQLGVTELIKRRPPGPDEPRLTLPDWALTRVDAIAREIVDGIKGSGVRVIGDVEELAPVLHLESASGAPAAGQTAVAAVAAAWPDVVTAAAMGVLLTGDSLPKGRRGAGGAWPDADGSSGAWEPVTDPHGRLAGVVSTQGLQRLLIGRVRSFLRPRDRARTALARLRDLAGRSASIHSAGVEVE